MKKQHLHKLLPFLLAALPAGIMAFFWTGAGIEKALGRYLEAW